MNNRNIAAALVIGVIVGGAGGFSIESYQATKVATAARAAAETAATDAFILGACQNRFDPCTLTINVTSSSGTHSTYDVVHGAVFDTSVNSSTPVPSLPFACTGLMRAQDEPGSEGGMCEVAPPPAELK